MTGEAQQAGTAPADTNGPSAGGAPKGLAGLIPERASKLGAIDIPELKLPVGGGALKGIDEKFSVNASNGTASMSIALPLTPNRDAFTPKLSLSYSSGAGNGVFGLGWTLGLSAIQRKTDRLLPRYLLGPEEDVFMISGSEDLMPRLVEAGPGNWQPIDAAAGAYRVRPYVPRIAGDLARIERISHPEHGEYWKVTDRTNMVTIYGHSAAARIADPADPTRVFQWLPEFGYDNRGNWIAYVYRVENGAGMPATAAEENRRSGRAPFVNAYLKRVRYGNHVPWFPDPAHPYDPPRPADTHCHFEAVLDYGEHDSAAPGPDAAPGQDWTWRADAFSSYRSGFEIRTARLCRRVLMFHHFKDEELGEGALVRSLDLAYTPVSVNGVGQAAAVVLSAAEQAGYVRRAGGDYSRRAIPPLSFEYQPIGWDMTARTAPAEAVLDAPVGLSEPYRLIDLYGEGIAGILCQAGPAWLYKHNRGADPATGAPRFERARTLEARPNVTGLADAAVSFEDLDANGEKQVVAFGPQVGGYFSLGRDAWEPFRPFPQATNLDFRDPSVRRIDLTGDGRLSIILAADDAFVWYAAKGRDGFGPAERALRALDEESGPLVVFAEAEQTVFLADMSGDGLTDIVRIRNGEVSYWPNLGYGRFGARVAMTGAPVFDHPDRFDPARVRLAGITGTGPSDLIYLGPDRVRVWLNQAGNGWSAAVDIPALRPGDAFHDVQVADLFGHGTPCLVWSSRLPGAIDSPLRYIDLMGGRKPHLMTRYRNNLGKETVLEYRSSTVDYLRDRDAGLDWAARLPFPVQVVARQELTEQVSGARLVSGYAYHHGYWDPVEREFRGFGRVDRTDSEDFEAWSEPMPGGPLAVARQQFQAPMLTRTWYHVGAFEDSDRLLTRFAAEYWPAAHDAAFPADALDLVEPALPDGRLEAAATILDPAAIARLLPEERREAQRACKSLVLRQEVFALDAPATGATGADLRRQMRPYTVDTHSCHIQLLQPRGPNAHAVFLVVEDEALKINYDRNPDDPRVEHALNLEIDELGNVLESATAVYGRDAAVAAISLAAIAADATDYAGFDEQASLAASLTDALDRAEASQTRTRLMVARNGFTNDIDTAAVWRSRLPCEVESFEITGLLSGGTLFTRAELTGILTDAKSTEIAYESTPGGGVQRRRIEHSLTGYYDEGLAAELPAGQIASHGLPYQSRTLALTQSLIAALFGARLPPGPGTATTLTAAGYVHDATTGDWWIPAGHSRYLDPGDALADARARFLKPRAHIDPFGSETRVAYHKDYFLVLEATQDAVGNRTRAEAFDFRSLAPVVLRDANDNLSAVTLDELSLVVALAFLGKDLDEDGTAELEVADALTGQSSDSTIDAATAAAYLAATDSIVLEPLARQLLRQATTRFVYDVDRWRVSGAPAAGARITRTRHHSDDPNAPLQLSFEYIDGSGAVAMTKTQAESGPARTTALNPDGSVTVGQTDTALAVPPRLRWVGSGRTVLNNKANPVRKYEPYFSVSPAYESLPDLVATGVSATLTYDPAGRLVRTDMPDGTFLTAEFDAWRVVNHDAGDTVAGSRWHDDRVYRRIDAELIAQGRDPEREAAAAAAAATTYAGTPATILMGVQGRPILSLDHLGFDAGGKAVRVPTSIRVDVEGNVLEVFDARGNRPIAYGYDLAGRRLTQASMDAGTRWMLPTVTGRPHATWDERGHALRVTYDEAQRPLSERVTGGDGPVPLDNVVMRAEYGEGEPDDRRDGLRGQMVRRWDLGGLEEWRRFDFKGNVTETARRFAADYRETPDWTGDLLAPLEAETHVTRQGHDALSRVVTITAPDGSVTAKRYSPGNYLDRVDATPAGGAADAIVTAIRHDAKGQRVSISHGNGTRTDYRYDPLTFRLLGITSTTSGGAVVQDLAYTHDCVGNLTHREDRAIPAVYFSNAVITALSVFGYDALYRLTSAEGREHAGQSPGGFGPADNWNDAAQTVVHAPGDTMAWRNYTETYRHDPVGNLLRLAHAAPGAGFTRTYTYEAATNRLRATVVGADTYPLDHHPTHGFIRSMPHLPVMAYDHRDQMASSATQIVNAGTPETTWYIYDHDGRRIRKVTDLALNGPGQPQRKEERLYLGGLEIHRRHAGVNAGLQRRTLSVMDDRTRVAMIDDRNDVDDGTPARVTRYQLANHLGSVAMELDGAERLLSYEEYHPFGTTAYRATGSALQVAERRYRYSGMERDEESGFSYHSARYYAPWIGRWTKPDVAALDDGINDYQYTSGNPIRLTDPTGMGGWDRFWGGVKMVGGALETAAGGALVVAGAATGWTGIGVAVAAAGGVVTAHGLDVTVSGGRTMWNGEQVDTFTSQGLQAAGVSRGKANLIDAGFSFVGSLGSGAITRAPGVVAAGERALASGEDVARVAAAGADEASSVTIAFKPGLPVGHNMVGVTTSGTTSWSHLVVESLKPVSGGASQIVAPGTRALVIASEGGPSASYLRATLQVTSEQATAARTAQTAAQTLESAGTYSYFANNCTTYAASILREAGVFAPATNTPATAFLTVALQSPEVLQPLAVASATTSGAVLTHAAVEYSSAEPPTPTSTATPLSQAFAVSTSVVSSLAVTVSTSASGPAPQVSPGDDPASQVCRAEGSYDAEAPVCYAQ
jgi:RHS repeat-associated protein